jgi:hypothetical protein
VHIYYSTPHSHQIWKPSYKPTGIPCLKKIDTLLEQ